MRTAKLFLVTIIKFKWRSVIEDMIKGPSEREKEWRPPNDSLACEINGSYRRAGGVIIL
jgi:hypothetical protein